MSVFLLGFANGNELQQNNVTDVLCYACGLKEIDPNLDQAGSFGDARKPWTPAGKKMYNYTCDIAHEMGLDDKWLRKCPHGVKSCFWSRATYQGHGDLF